MTPRVSTLFLIGCTTKDDMLKSFRLEVEENCRRWRSSPLAEVLSCYLIKKVKVF